jgi:type I restriction-modification system DNA methylase subunit
VNKKSISSGDTETIKQEIRKLIEKYDRVAEEKRINQYNEEMTKKDFILPLFRALGWNTEDSSEVSAEEKISKKRADYSFRINGIPKFFLEAKPIKADLNKPEYIEQAINYAWHKGCPWAVLTDFENIKIYNAEWKSENPIQQNLLKDIPCPSFIERFDELFLLSKESFEKGLLDKEAEKWGKRTKKISVDKQLLTDFTRFRELLSKNITKLNQSKNITEEDLDEAVQRILDRLIFIRNCEDRELEAKTLISGYREWESRGRGQLIKSLRNIFIDFDKKYNSKIFANHLCDSLDIDNEVLHEIIEGLYYTKDKSVSYDFSAIDADVLGTIYEQYLGNILRKSEKRAKLTENHMHRKEQGIYYTPTYIVDFIVKNTLGELLKDKKINVEKIRILDPACGSGSFLIKAFDILNKYWMEKDKTYDQLHLDYTGTGESYSKKIGILQNSIFGVDLDKQAVEIAQLNLLLRITEKGQRLPLLQQNIKCGNSLIDDPAIAGDKAFKWEEEFKQIMDEGGFDVVIGNPPYVRADVDNISYQKQRKEMESSGQYETLYEKWDLYIAFIERGLKLLKEGGRFSFIISNSFNTSKYADKLKKYILDNYYLKQIDFFKNVEVFKGVGVESVILTIEKTKAKRKTRRILHINSFDNYTELTPSDDIVKMFRISTEIDFDKKIENTQLLGEICYLSVGMVLNANEKTAKGEFKKDELISNIKDAIHTKSYVEAEDITRYFIKHLRYLEWNTNRIPKKIRRPTFPELYIHTKLIRGRTTDAIFDENQLVCNDGCIVIVPFSELKGVNNRSIEGSIKKWSNKNRNQLEEISKEFNLKYILGILNSKFAKFYLNTIRRHRIEYYFYPDDIKNLPIKIVPESQQQLLIQLVDKMLSLNKRLNEIGDKKTDERADIEEEIKHTDNEIDELVYKIYGITEEEKKIIEESLK